MGQGLFFKIFTSFWLTVILTGMTLEAAASFLRKGNWVQGSRLEKTLPAAAYGAAVQLEGARESGLAGYLSDFQRTQSITAYFFDDRGDELTHRGVSSAIRKEALLALREAGFHRSGDGGEIAALQVVGRKGNAYAMVFILPRRMNW